MNRTKLRVLLLVLGWLFITSAPAQTKVVVIPFGDGGAPQNVNVVGHGNLDATSQEIVVIIPAIGMEVRTDGDADNDMVVQLHNTGSDGIASLIPGAGNASAIIAGTFEPLEVPGNYAPTYLDNGGDPDTFTPAARADAVLLKGDVRVWIECVFPLNDVICRATIIQ